MKVSILFVILVLILGACSSDRAPKIHVHERPDVSPEEEAPVVKYDLAFFQEFSIEELEASTSESVEKRVETLEKLGKQLFLSERMASEEYQKDQDIRRYLRAYNTLLISLRDNISDNEKVAQLYEMYDGWMFEDCRLEELRGCKNHPFFKSDPQSSIVIRILGEKRSKSNVKQAYRYYALAVDFQSSRRIDLELNKILVAGSVDFFSAFVNEEVSGNSFNLELKPDLSETDLEFLSQITGLVAASLGLWTEISEDPRVVSIMPRLIKWYESGTLETTLSRAFSEAISQIIRKNLKDEAVWKEYVDSINRDQSRAGSYSNVVKDLKSDGAKLINVLNYSPISYSDLQKNKDDMIYLYFITKLMDGKNSGQLSNFWEASEKNVPRLLDILESVIKANLIEAIKFSNSKMAEYQQEHKRRGHSPGILIDKLEEWSQTRVEPKWSVFHSEVFRIRSYFEAYIEGQATYRSNEQIWNRIKQTRLMFDRLNDNIKLLVTYPNIIILGYLAAKLDFNMVLQGMGMKITVNKDVVLDQLIKGLIPPFFKYTRYELDGESIDTVQIQYAMYYSIATGLLQDHGIDVKDFMRVFFSKYLDRDRQKIRVWIRRFLNLEKEGSGYDQAMDLCKAIDEGRSRAVVNSIRFQDLRFYSFFGYEGHGESSDLMNETSSAIAATAMTRTFDEAIEMLRSDVDPKLRQLYLLKQMFLEVGQTDAVTAVEDLFNEIEAMRNITFEKATSIYFNLRKCLRKVAKVEHERRREVFDFERQFGLYVYEALSALRDFKDNSNKSVSELKTIYPDHSFWSVAYFSDMDSSLPLLEALNTKLLNSQLYKPAMDAILGYREDMISLGGFKVSSDGRYYFSARKFDLYTRIAGYLLNGFNGNDLTRRPDRFDLKFPTSMNELRQIILLWFTDREPVKHLYVFDDSDGDINRDLFKRRFLQYFASNSRWFRDLGGSVSYLRNAWRAEVAFLKYEPQLELDISKIIDCNQLCQTVKYNRVLARSKIHLKNILEDLDRYNLVESDVELLRELQWYSFFSEHSGIMTAGPRHLFVTGGISDVMKSPFDESFNYLVSIRLGENPEFRGYIPNSEKSWLPPDQSNARGEMNITPEMMMGRLNPYYWSLEFFESIRDSKKNLIFEVPERIRDLISAHFSEQFRNDMRIVDTYLKATKEISDNWDLESIQFSLVEPAHTDFEPITSGLVGQYFQDLRRFNSNTQNIFIPEEFRGQERWTNYKNQ